MPEDLGRKLYLDSLAFESATSHTSTEDGLVSVDSIPDHAARAVPGPFVPLAATEFVNGVDVPVSLLQCG